MTSAQPLECATTAGFAAAVARGLSGPGQKTLPCKYLYDAVGSRLFAAICALPEYGLAAADARLIQHHAEEMTAAFAAPQGGGILVAELGSGNGHKTRWLLEALGRRTAVEYAPIEISPEALEECRRGLGGIAGVEMHPQLGEYIEGLSAVAARRQGRQRLLVLFLGSTLGNFAAEEAPALLASIRRRLKPGDGLLLGLDLVKPRAALRAAYDDAAGVTAAFNLNLLARMNREMGADFDLRRWQHRVRIQNDKVEMHLRSRGDQTVSIPGAGLRVRFQRGETIWTESSRKFRLREIATLASASGFRAERQWVDTAWPFVECQMLVRG